MTGSLVVSEVFGPTIQGEGPSAGRPAMFVRLGLCNLDCGAGLGATWSCDTPYTWDWLGKLGERFDRAEQLTHRTVDDVAAAVTDRGPTLIVVSGGEPMIQQAALADLVAALYGYDVEVETNGTRAPNSALVALHDEGRVEFNVSPKLTGSGVDPCRAINPAALDALVGCDARFKFVVSTRAQLDEVSDLVERFAIPPASVWIMPSGVDSDELARRARLLLDDVIARRWQLTDRLHVRLWGNRRGV